MILLGVTKARKLALGLLLVLGEHQPRDEQQLQLIPNQDSAHREASTGSPLLAPRPSAARPWSARGTAGRYGRSGPGQRHPRPTQGQQLSCGTGGERTGGQWRARPRASADGANPSARRWRAASRRRRRGFQARVTDPGTPSIRSRCNQKTQTLPPPP